MTSVRLGRRFTHSSLDTLRLARRLQQQGDLPASTQLWVVANPNTERDASLLERKVGHGAQRTMDNGSYHGGVRRGHGKVLETQYPVCKPDGARAVVGQQLCGCGVGCGGQGAGISLVPPNVSAASVPYLS